MSRIAYVNGRYKPFAEAHVHIEDRGYQFADGVYEVVVCWQGRFVDEEPHLDRLDRSLHALRLSPPMSRNALKAVLRETVRRNRLSDALVYIQVSRGVARRDHWFPPAETAPALVVTARRLMLDPPASVEKGVAVVTIPDIRWGRCDIKSIALLPNVLGKQEAREKGAAEAWQVDHDGFITEGTSTNAWIVAQDGTVVTRPADHAILNGITRLSLLDLLKKQGIPFSLRPFTVAEAKAAREAFLTSSSRFILPVVRIDGEAVGEGRAGTLTLRLRHLLLEGLQA